MSFQMLMFSQENKLPGLFWPLVSEGSAADSATLVPTGWPCAGRGAMQSHWFSPFCPSTRPLTVRCFLSGFNVQQTVKFTLSITTFTGSLGLSCAACLQYERQL